MHKIYHGYCRSVWEASQHPDIPGTQLKWKVSRDIPPSPCGYKKCLGKLFWHPLALSNTLLIILH